MDRLQKILSAAGVASRRVAETLIVQGRVSVNGAVVRELGTKADPSRDEIRVDGRRVKLPERRLYLLLNKPRGYVTTRADPEGRPTIMDLLGGVREYVYPVGRLDYDTEGLLLLTNDGELAAQLTHPRHGVVRVYEARVRGVPDGKALAALAHGVVIEGRRTLPAEVTLLSPGRGRDADESVISISVREGRNRQVRRMCESVGHPVRHLQRVAIGPLRDARLKPGRYRELLPAEVERLRRAASTGHAPLQGQAGSAARGPAAGRRRSSPR